MAALYCAVNAPFRFKTNKTLTLLRRLAKRIIVAMKQIVEVASALGDESRLRILLCLKDSTLCLCHLTEILGLAGSTVSCCPPSCDR